MKHIRLFQTTQAMQNELNNIPKPYIAVAEDNLNSPVIEKYVAATPLKLYITQKAHNNTLGIYVNGTLINEYIEETGTIPWGSDASTDFDQYSYYIELNTGDEITAEYTEGGAGFRFMNVNTGFVEDSENVIGGSNPGTKVTVGNNDLVLTNNVS